MLAYVRVCFVESVFEASLSDKLVFELGRQRHCEVIKSLRNKNAYWPDGGFQIMRI